MIIWLFFKILQWKEQGFSYTIIINGVVRKFFANCVTVWKFEIRIYCQRHCKKYCNRLERYLFGESIVFNIIAIIISIIFVFTSSTISIIVTVIVIIIVPISLIIIVLINLISIVRIIIGIIVIIILWIFIMLIIVVVINVCVLDRCLILVDCSL